jgi:hypothetical protein
MIGEVVHVGALGFTRWSPFSPSIGVVVDQFLYRVNGDNRLVVVDVVEMVNWASRLSSNDLSQPPGERRRTDGSIPAITSPSALITVFRLIPDALAPAVLPRANISADALEVDLAFHPPIRTPLASFGCAE